MCVKCGEKESSTAGHSEENLRGVRKDRSRGKRFQGQCKIAGKCDLHLVNAFTARIGARLSHTHMKKPGIRLRSRLLQPLEDL